jgi:hypothetical protein
MDGKVQSITTILCFISYERESIAKLQFSTTCFGLFGPHQVVLLPVKEEIYTIWGARGGEFIGDEISFPIMLNIVGYRKYSGMET